MDKELQGIKERVNTSYFYQDNPPEAHGDVLYLLNRLEAAEKASQEGYKLGRTDALNDVIENMQMYLDELKRSREYLVNKKEEQKHG